MTPNIFAEAVSVGENAVLIQTQLILRFGQERGVLGMDVLDMLNELFQEAYVVNADTDQMGRVVI